MTRVKGGTVSKTRRRKVLKAAKGYFGSKHRLYKTAQEQVFHSGVYAYRDRRQNKRNFRKLWITRINAACRLNEISYSKFISGLNKAGVEVNRKMLSELAIDDAKGFAALVKIAKDANDGKVAKKEAPAKKETVKKETTTKKVEEKKETKTASKDYSKLTLAELKEEAKKKDIKGYSTMKKAELIAALK
jgi:large subunit ribosomal protein L20